MLRGPRGGSLSPSGRRRRCPPRPPLGPGCPCGGRRPGCAAVAGACRGPWRGCSAPPPAAAHHDHDPGRCPLGPVQAAIRGRCVKRHADNSGPGSAASRCQHATAPAVPCIVMARAAAAGAAYHRRCGGTLTGHCLAPTRGGPATRLSGFKLSLQLQGLGLERPGPNIRASDSDSSLGHGGGKAGLGLGTSRDSVSGNQAYWRQETRTFLGPGGPEFESQGSS